MIENRPWLTVFAHFVLICGVALIAFPIWVTFVASTHDAGTMLRSPIPLLPGPHLVDNYVLVLTEGFAQASRTPLWKVLLTANWAQFIAGLLLLGAVLTGIGGVVSVAIGVFIFVSAQGFVFPNGSAIAMMRHGDIAGTASAMLGTNQFLIAAVTTAMLGYIKDPDGILLRSFKMHDMEIPKTLKAVGRAGAGVNNIPVETLSRFSFQIQLDAAIKLGLPPPLPMFNYAEFVQPPAPAN